MKNTSGTPILGALLTFALFAGCSGESLEPTSPEKGAASATREDDAEHVHHFAWLSDDIARGAQPVGEEAFRELAAKGIRTIISVDGARPDVATAGRFDLRYVHIPFGYEGVPEDRQRQLAKTVRELEGPFFVHCHHGKHRGPAGAVICQMSLGGMTNEEAVAELKRAQTAEKYTGLYGTALVFTAPSAEQTESLDFDFPAVAPVPEFPAAMADLDRRFDNLKLVRAAGWKAVADHPDIDPPHEALQAHELLQEMDRLPVTHPEPYGELMKQAVTTSGDLEKALRADPADFDGAEGAFRGLAQSCSKCHGDFRNTPEGADR